MNDELLTIREVAELLKVTPATIRNWRRRLAFPAVHVSQRRVYYRRGEVYQWLLERDKIMRLPHIDHA